MLSVVQQIDMRDWLTGDMLAERLGVHRTTIQRRVGRMPEYMPDALAPYGVTYYAPEHAAELAREALDRAEARTARMREAQAQPP